MSITNWSLFEISEKSGRVRHVELLDHISYYLAQVIQILDIVTI